MRGHVSAAQLLAARQATQATRSGTVYKKLQGFYLVHVDGKEVRCTISSRLRKVLVYPLADATSMHPRVQEVEEIKVADPIAVGDIVNFVDAHNGTGVILEVLERTNALVRRAAGRKVLEQVIVANVDQVICVIAAAMPAPSWELLDRYLAAAEASDLPAIVCITKADLYNTADFKDELQNYERLGYRVIITSSASGQGIDQLRQMMTGRVSVLFGKSGVGKTTLLNAIQPGLGLRVNEVSGKTGKGKHTTTNLEMFALGDGGSVADTPGMREFALWNIHARDLVDLFPDLRPYVGECKFGLDCSHSHEPGCAIKAAVDSGDITARRHQSYLRIRSDL